MLVKSDVAEAVDEVDELPEVVEEGLIRGLRLLHFIQSESIQYLYLNPTLINRDFLQNTYHHLLMNTYSSLIFLEKAESRSPWIFNSSFFFL